MSIKQSKTIDQPQLDCQPPEAKLSVKQNQLLNKTKTKNEMKRLQNRIAQSRFALPLMAVYGTVVWAFAGLLEGNTYIGFLLFGLATYVMLTINNSNVLIRIYSRMVSCSFIALVSAAAFMFHETDVMAQGALMSVMYLSLFNCYQDKHSSGYAFYAFLMIGIISMFFIRILFLVPVLWIILALALYALNFKTFLASLLGLAAPYWFWSAYCITGGTMDPIWQHLGTLFCLSLPAVEDIPNLPRLITLLLVAVVSVTGMVHILRKNFKEKIRTRMIYNGFITMFFALLVFMALQPDCFDYLLIDMMLGGAALIGHFLALTETKVTNWAFKTLVFITLGLTFYNLWTLS